MVRVEETPAGDASGAESPCAKTDRKRPINLPEVAGNDGPALLAAPPPPPPRAGAMKFAEKTREPLQLMVNAQTDPAGQFSATGMLSPSDCYPVGPAGPYATGGPCRPRCIYYRSEFIDACDSETLPDPDGHDATTGPVGPYVGRGPVGPADCLPVLKSCKHLIPAHTDPVGQHDAESDTAELLDYEVVENILDGRPMKGITWPELLECSIGLLDSSLEGKLEEEISDWEPEASPVPETNLDSGHCLVARAIEGVAEEVLNHKPVMNPVQNSDPDGQLREEKEYENQSYVEKTEETQFSYDAGLSGQELEDAIRLEVLRNRFR